MIKTRNGQIRNVVTANGLWFPNLNKETNGSFTVSTTHNLFSFATMIGPSPDWLTGLSKFDLCSSDCTWLDTHSEYLYPFDAGTDSGLSYNVCALDLDISFFFFFYFISTSDLIINFALR